jgi:hypothetical protein
MGYNRISERQRSTYMQNRFDFGLTRAAAAKKARISESSAKRLESLHNQDSTSSRALDKASERLSGPIPYNQLSDRAKHCWDCFSCFRTTYLGHISTPWQVETANTIVRLLNTPDKEFVVENCPPGAGKSTLAVDIACWLIVRQRTVRILFGSRVQSNADRSLKRTRRTLERTVVYKAPDEEIQKGISCDAQATLAQDYGLFRPVAAETWRGDEFIVAQFDDLPIEEKEPTCSSYGMDSGVLGNRFNLAIWDDTVDKTTIRTMEATENQRQWWDDEAETRIEPGGLMWLIGQRMAANDLYRYCLDKNMPLSEDDEDDEQTENSQRNKYSHVLYLAHYEDRCQGRATHRRDAPAYPDGCLLDPYRLPWRDLYDTMHTKTQTWRVQYQQEDADPATSLIRMVWVHGGTDPDAGTTHPGCKDETRGLLELPKMLKGPHYYFATVDPSPTKWWAIHYYCYTPEASNRLWLLDLLRVKMGGNELLDIDPNTGTYSGVMNDWQERSVELGMRITDWIVEINAAQRFLLQYQFVANWQGKHNVNIRPHQTTIRKLDPNLGIDMVRDWWAFGRVRLPYKDTAARLASLKLIDEATKHPHGQSDDQVMAHWFAVTHLPKIAVNSAVTKSLPRPSWVRSLPDARPLTAVVNQ